MTRRHKPTDAAKASALAVSTPGGPLRLAYFRVSTLDQSIEAQRADLGGGFHREFIDENVSGVIPMAQRPGFKALLDQAREGDTLCVAAVDRLGRDAIDVQKTCRALLNRGVLIDIKGLGLIGRGVGELIVAVLAQVADMERHRILSRANAGRVAARASLEKTGMTHRGKESLGRPWANDPATVIAWRRAHEASALTTANHFGISPRTVKRYCAENDPALAAKLARGKAA